MKFSYFVCELTEYISIAVYTGGLAKNTFGLWRREKIEFENNQTIFEICVLNPFHGQKIKENFSWTVSREDRS